ncbi:signal peptidase I [Candidatus Saccharibacteria bacterium]|nr:signal peptidase I [Candidatus Saccharibacteria bacterium]
MTESENQESKDTVVSYNGQNHKVMKMSASRVFKGLSGTLGLLIAAPLLALLITSHIFQPYQVDGQSMETTLQDGDRLIVYKLPKTISNLGGSAYIPGRWDIIVFDKPKQLNAPESTKHLIKRVIGLPGERVLIRQGKVTIFNKDNPEGFDPDANKDYSKDIISTSGNVDLTVGSNEVFVLGDNRGNSADSRVFGPIPSSIIVGDATVRFIPVNNMKRL